jgi:hypothetical protein
VGNKRNCQSDYGSGKKSQDEGKVYFTNILGKAAQAGVNTPTSEHQSAYR